MLNWYFGIPCTLREFVHSRPLAFKKKSTVWHPPRLQKMAGHVMFPMHIIDFVSPSPLLKLVTPHLFPPSLLPKIGGCFGKGGCHTANHDHARASNQGSQGWRTRTWSWCKPSCTISYASRMYVHPSLLPLSCCWLLLAAAAAAYNNTATQGLRSSFCSSAILGCLFLQCIRMSVAVFLPSSLQTHTAAADNPNGKKNLIWNNTTFGPSSRHFDESAGRVHNAATGNGDAVGSIYQPKEWI